MILCKLQFIADQNELKLDLTDNFGQTLQYCQNFLRFHPQCSSLALSLSRKHNYKSNYNSSQLYSYIP